MSKNIKVSVIIPNYNHALFLKQRIDSVLSQTFQDFELIILDDCSTDTSREIIEIYRGNPKISQIIFNTENSGGVFKQWIKGIENAKGDYIWIAESDDYAAENFLEESLKVIEQDASLGMVFTNSNAVNNEGEFLTTTAESKNVSYTQLATYQNRIDKENISLFLVSEMIVENASCVLFRKNNISQIDFDELINFTNTGDRFVYIGIALKSKMEYIAKPLNYMRSHVNNTTKKSFENGNIHKDRLRVLNYYFNELYAEPSNRKNTVDFYKTNYIAFVTFGDYDENMQLLKKLKEKKEIQSGFYNLVRYYLYLFRKVNIKIPFLRGFYYRILISQKLI